MLTTAENLPPPPPPTTDDDTLYHSDDVGLRDTPPLEPKKVNLQPSPSPPLILPDQDTSDSSPDPQDRKRPHRPKKKRGSQGDALLVHVMDGGKRPDIARLAGQEQLASEEDEGEAATRVVTSVDLKKDVNNLAAIAAGALAHQGHTARDPRERAVTLGARENGPGSHLQLAGGEPMEGLKPSIPPLSSSYSGDARRPPSPDASVKSEIMATPTPSGLPPIRQHSPQSHLPNGNGLTPITLPSISSQLGDLNHLAEAAATGDSPYPTSPSARPPHRYSTIPGHGSPPKSPNDAFRRGLPSPGNYYYSTGNHQRIQPVDGHYNGSNAETPTPDHPGTAPALAIDRMSIDGITNPQIGGFQCTYPNCTAQPFQTQYLLNSHANVHSSNRPHYCSVKGCPRSEGGKGFKRKNEMIRHGLVHDSPGYVCPFCPDREHKYPRPDNLQRHVRVHHVDRDKDDPQLRDVLSQRPEGPSRGRRRRGGPS